MNLNNYMKKHAILFLILFMALNLDVNAQSDGIAIRVSAGPTSHTKLLDGYFYSFDVGVPFLKYFEIAPTFTGSSVAPAKYIGFSYRDHGTDITNSGSSAPKVDAGGTIQADIYHSAGLVLYIKPLKAIDSKRHELLAGVGMAYESYTRTYAWFAEQSEGGEMISFNQKMVTGFAPIYARLSYNYYFKEKASIGLVASVHDYDGDGGLFCGVQLGCRF
jgi:hypothetical protein